MAWANRRKTAQKSKSNTKKRNAKRKNTCPDTSSDEDYHLSDESEEEKQVSSLVSHH
jgi:replication initiation and membrane attachment protein DnaB